MKYKRDHNKPAENAKLDLIEAIANEIAEQNRLTRISLTNSFMQAAASQLYKQGKNEKDEPILLEPTEEDRKQYDQLVAGIEFTLGDHLGKIDEDKLKEMQEAQKKEGDQTEN